MRHKMKVLYIHSNKKKKNSYKDNYFSIIIMITTVIEFILCIFRYSKAIMLLSFFLFTQNLSVSFLYHLYLIE